MKAKNLLGVLAGLVVAIIPVQAAEVVSEVASIAVRNWIARNDSPLEMRFAHAQALDTQTFKDDDGKTLFHVVALDGGGYVVTSGDTKINPIVAFADEGEFDADEGNPLLALLRRDLSLRLAAVEAAETPLVARTRLSLKTASSRDDEPLPLAANLDCAGAEEMWADLTDGLLVDFSKALSSSARLGAGYGLPGDPCASQTGLSDVRVAPITSSCWGQTAQWNGNYIYNLHTPDHYALGCTATALAQIMRYWQQLPIGIVAKNTVACRFEYADRNFTMKGGTYDWSKMPLKFSGITSVAHCNEIGKFCYDVAVACKMHWFSSGGDTAGAASVWNASKGLKTYFGYKSADYIYYGPSYSGLASSNYAGGILGSLNAGMPALISIWHVSDSGEEAQNGHSVVADGYGFLKSQLYVHLNIGWGGTGNAYYNLFLEPMKIGSTSWNLLSSSIVNIHPTKTGTVVSGRVTNSAGAAQAGAQVIVTSPSNVKQSVVANAKGIWSVQTSETGTYSVHAEYGEKMSAIQTPYVDLAEGNASCNIWNLDLVLNRYIPPTPPVLSIPTHGMTANADYVQLSWSGATRAKEYNIYRATSPNGVRSKIATGITEMTYRDRSSSLVPGWDYYYWVEAANEGAETATSACAIGNLAVVLTPSDDMAMIEHDGGTTRLSIAANASWTATTTAPWLTLTTAGTSGNGTVSFHAGAWSDLTQRVAQVSLETTNAPDHPRSLTVKVVQAGRPSWAITDSGLLYNVELNGCIRAAIPSGTTTIGRSVFANQVDLVSILIPNSITNIEYRAFGGCRSLKQVALPSRVRTIGAFAFEGCSELESVSIPSVVEKMGSYAFYACERLKSLTLPKRMTCVPQGLCADCKSLESVVIPSKVGDIGQFAFGGCQSLKSLSIPTSVTNIDEYAFCGCSSLKTLSIPANVKTIGQSAFENCIGLEKVTIHWSLKNRLALSSIFGSLASAGDVMFKYGGACSVKFDAVGGAGGKTQTVNYGTTLGTLPSVTRTGYAFAGWHTAKSGGSKVSASAKVTKDVTYYAHWTANKYTVKFDANGGTGTMKAQARTYNDKKALTSNAFKRTNYHFKGWATTKGGSVKYADKQVANLSSKAGATMTLYAVWERSTYTVAFDGNGSTGGMTATESINVGATKALSANGYRRTGHSFQGWSTVEGSTKVVYKNKECVTNLSTENGATVTLYAVWKANAYTVEFDANGGTGTMANLAMTYGKAKALTANKFKRTNWTFLGWSKTKKTGSCRAKDVNYQNKASVKNLKTSGTVTLYAVWMRNTYTITFSANDGQGTTRELTANCGANVTLAANSFKRAGYEFLGWAKSPKATAATYTDRAKVKDLAKTGKSVTLYAVWSLPAWAKGSFNGRGGYWSPSRKARFDGISTAMVSSLGKLSGTLTLAAPGGGTETARFSALTFSSYYSSRSINQLLDLLDYDEVGDPYDIMDTISECAALTKVAVYVYKDVKLKMPDGKAHKTDFILASLPYENGKTLRGWIAAACKPNFDLVLDEDVFTSERVPLPQFRGTPTKKFNVTSDPKDDEDDLSYVTKVEVTFGANGALTVVGNKGMTKEWSASATLRLSGYSGGVFHGGTDFLTPDGTSLWFNCILKPGKDGKITASGITLDW